MATLRGHWQLILMIVVVFALWQTPAMIPLKILIVFLHELAHAAATVLTGGDVVSLTVSPAQGGAVLSRGGNRFVILSAGYLGSLLIGMAVLFIAIRTQIDRTAMAGFGLLMIFVALVYVRDIFAILFCLGTGAAMLAIARFLPRDVNDLILRAIGLTSMIYVPYDIFSDTIARAALRSDARMLAEEIGGATILWGGLWLAISLGLIWVSTRRILGRNSNLHWSRRR